MIAQVFYFFQTIKEVTIKEGFSKTGENNLINKGFFFFETSNDFFKNHRGHNLPFSFHKRVGTHKTASVARRRGFNKKIVGTGPILFRLFFDYCF